MPVMFCCSLILSLPTSHDIIHDGCFEQMGFLQGAFWNGSLGSVRLSVLNCRVFSCHRDVISAAVLSSSAVAVLELAFTFKSCFRHAKLAASLWVNAVCERWDGKVRVSPQLAAHCHLQSVAFFFFSCSLACRSWLLTKKENKNIGCSTPIILSMWGQSDSFIHVLLHPGCF